MTPRAVVFTHVGDKENLRDPNQLQSFVQRRLPFFEACLRCRNVGLVFIYSSYGVEYFLHALKVSANPELPMFALETEQHIYDAIHIAIDEAARRVGGSATRFVFIGVRELASHLLRLQRMDPDLVKSLGTQEGAFTYDSPKYVEAMLRVARARGELANDPIVRVDIDVEVNEDAIQKILDQAQICAQNWSACAFWWFSGWYTGKSNTDPLNIHAVRQHWLVEPRVGTADTVHVLPAKAESFLVDLAEIGATQIAPPPEGGLDRRLSGPARRLIASRGGRSRNRGTPQVISGAGLVASPEAIRRLPPFINAPEMVVWIDDHLKRLLHERIGDAPAPVERIPDARMRQDRYPTGLKQDPVRTREYFYRLLNGCLLEAAVEEGPFAEAVHATVESLSLSPHNRAAQILAVVEQRCREVMSVWTDADYGADDLREWALSLSKTQLEQRCDLTVTVCEEYLKLCHRWRDHVAAIHSLLPQDAYWLFTSAAVSTTPAVEVRLPIRKPPSPRPSTTPARAGTSGPPKTR